jgi:[protein-PII] uridylyltransferase
MNCDVAALRAEVKANQLQLRQHYECSNDARALLRERRAGRCGTRETLARLRLPASLALAAVGGYGRGELFPASDIDLLILLPTETSKTTQEKLERLVSHFWDIGLEIGHSVRTIQECLNEAAQDITVQTALLEARLLTGNAKLFATFQKRLHGNLDPLVFSKPSDSSSRNATCASTKPLQPGAELQGIAGWPARPAGHLLGRQGRRLRRKLGRTAGERHHHPEGRRLTEACEDYLIHLRIRLHFMIGRREDRLLFDYQNNLAENFGFVTNEAKRASEQLMQVYYRHAKTVTVLNIIMLQNIAPR